MFNLLTRFHLLLLTVLLAMTVVAFVRVPPDFAYPALWGPHSEPAWVWPRDLALLLAPAAAVIVTVLFMVLGALLTKSRLLQSRHVYDPALTMVLLVILAVQMGLLLQGVGSDIDLIHMTTYGLAAILVSLGVVLFGAERNSYAGLRLPWPIIGDRAWATVHRLAGISFFLVGAALGLLGWQGLDLQWELLALVAALILPPLAAALATMLVPSE